ncbi:hypothetical protein PHET_08722 [Paragonimus heterotremus]|uniref:Uncharacterized protein n=1 Tax=Paragonimus heterotremus TaxID=100268 RepID=A0A8J4WFC7_9TREM|nr:hypothetical protein PHET_08722 [Paragonimus heterotremus]
MCNSVTYHCPSSFINLSLWVRFVSTFYFVDNITADFSLSIAAAKQAKKEEKQHSKHHKRKKKHEKSHDSGSSNHSDRLHRTKHEIKSKKHRKHHKKKERHKS